MAIITDIETRLRERLSRPGRVQISAKTWSTGEAAIGAPKVFESAEALSFAAAWSPIISRTTLIPASRFVMIKSSRKAQDFFPLRLSERLEDPSQGVERPHHRLPQALEQFIATASNSCTMHKTRVISLLETFAVFFLLVM